MLQPLFRYYSRQLVQVHYLHLDRHNHLIRSLRNSMLSFFFSLQQITCKYKITRHYRVGAPIWNNHVTPHAPTPLPSTHQSRWPHIAKKQTRTNKSGYIFVSYLLLLLPPPPFQRWITMDRNASRHDIQNRRFLKY